MLLQVLLCLGIHLYLPNQHLHPMLQHISVVILKNGC